MALLALRPAAPQGAAAAGAELDPYRRWALALPGIVMEINGQRHDILSAYGPGEGDVEERKRSLDRSWGVSDRDSLLSEIDKLEYDGHAPVFQSLIGIVGAELAKGKTPDQIVADRKPRMKDRDFGYLQFIAYNYDRFKGKNLFLWDWGRIISLARWGYFCGYVSEDEAWQITLRAAGLIFDNYHSWEEYGELYSLARAAWAAGFGDELIEYVRSERVMKKLLGEGGAWRSAPWPSAAPAEEAR